ncbi:MAG: protein-export chaperone SecB [Alphaproteobacteria bacterium]|nr:protein-export chaperone SecB [Alphaproteobacteria bacterium]MCL2505655.1 protein-export chaperone SecB [Alphaproteobacteria bacterium]
MTESNQTGTGAVVSMGIQYVKDFSFESPNTPEIFNVIKEPPKMMLDVNVMYKQLGDAAFESVLKLRLEAKTQNTTAFIAEIEYAGIFSLSGLSEDQKKMFLLVEAPRHLFPYARAVITHAVSEGGFPGVVLQPIDFMALYAANNANGQTVGTA